MSLTAIDAIVIVIAQLSINYLTFYATNIGFYEDCNMNFHYQNDRKLF